MIIKVELHEGKAYALDENGNVWEFVDTWQQHQCEIRLITRLSYEARDSAMIPQLARFASK